MSNAPADGADAVTIHAISHITLTVTDLERSVAWYEKTLGLKRLRDMAGDSWRRVLLLGDGVIVGLQQHDRTETDATFDEVMPGLDHVSFACSGRAEVESWARHFDKLGQEHSSIGGNPASVLTVKDPDGIALEFFAAPA